MLAAGPVFLNIILSLVLRYCTKLQVNSQLSPDFIALTFLPNICSREEPKIKTLITSRDPIVVNIFQVTKFKFVIKLFYRITISVNAKFLW